jgi:hypothetical protein
VPETPRRTCEKINNLTQRRENAKARKGEMLSLLSDALWLGVFA